MGFYCFTWLMGHSRPQNRFLPSAKKLFLKLNSTLAIFFCMVNRWVHNKLFKNWIFNVELILFFCCSFLIFQRSQYSFFRTVFKSIIIWVPSTSSLIYCWYSTWVGCFNHLSAVFSFSYDKYLSFLTFRLFGFSVVFYLNYSLITLLGT